MSATAASPSSSVPGEHGDEGLLDAFARRVTGDGASTLDMLKRPMKTQQDSGSITRHVPSRVRDEMLLQVRAGLGIQQSRVVRVFGGTHSPGHDMDRRPDLVCC